MNSDNNDLRHQNLTCPQCGVELTEDELQYNACAECLADIGTPTDFLHD